MNQSNLHNKSWLFCWLFFILLLPSCEQNKYRDYVSTAEEEASEYKRLMLSKLKIGLAEEKIKSGDLITRVGNDYTSQSLRTLNRRDTRYSHIGIASIEDNKVYVYHSLGGEWNPNEKIKREPLLNFADPSGNNAIGIFRFDISPSQIDSVLTLAKAEYKKGTTFDMQFDLATDDKLYCAEYISKMFERGTESVLRFPTHTLGFYTFVGVDDIFLHKRAREILHLWY